jgi:hypothetical protein
MKVIKNMARLPNKIVEVRVILSSRIQKAPLYGGASVLGWNYLVCLLRNNVGRIKSLRAGLGAKSHLLPLN